MCAKKPKVSSPAPTAPAVSAPMASGGATANMAPNGSVDNNQAKGKRRLTINPNSVGTGVNI